MIARLIVELVEKLERAGNRPLQCTLALGGFSGERLFEVELANGARYRGMAPRPFCWNKRGEFVAEGEPQHEAPGMVAARVLDRTDDGQAIVETPDGEVVAIATEERCEAKVAALRQELLEPAADDVPLRWKLACALDYKREFLKAPTPESNFALAEEAVSLVREATEQEPQNMFYRAELRRLLFRQVSLLTEGKNAAEFPRLFEEILSLAPLSDSEYGQAASLLSKWKNPHLQADLSDDQRKRIVEETDGWVVNLLRHQAEIRRNHPEEIEKKLREFEREATGASYAESPEFKNLLDEMRSWVTKGA